MGIGYGGILGETFSDIGQLNQETIGEGTMDVGVTVSYTPIHITRGFPESRLIELGLCANSAAMRRTKATAEWNESRCSQALTSLAPRRRGRA